MFEQSEAREQVEGVKNNIADILGRQANRVREEADNLYHDEELREEARDLAKKIAIIGAVIIGKAVLTTIIMGFERGLSGTVDDLNNTAGLLHLNNTTDLGGIIGHQNLTLDQQVYVDRLDYTGHPDSNPDFGYGDKEIVVPGIDNQNIESHRINFNNPPDSGSHPIITDKEMSFGQVEPPKPDQTITDKRMSFGQVEPPKPGTITDETKAFNSPDSGHQPVRVGNLEDPDTIKVGNLKNPEGVKIGTVGTGRPAGAELGSIADPNAPKSVEDLSKVSQHPTDYETKRLGGLNPEEHKIKNLSGSGSNLGEHPKTARLDQLRAKIFKIGKG